MAIDSRERNLIVRSSRYKYNIIKCLDFYKKFIINGNGMLMKKFEHAIFRTDKSICSCYIEEGGSGVCFCGKLV